MVLPRGWRPWASRPAWLTTEIDVSPWLEAKRGAMRAHRSQIAETQLLSRPAQDLFAALHRQRYIRVCRCRSGPGSGDPA